MGAIAAAVAAAVAGIDGLPTALSWLPRRLWVIPSFDMWQGETINADLLLGLCRDVAHRTDIPVVLIAGQTGVSAMDAAKAGARGILCDQV